jgi:ribonuclease D
MVDLLMAVVRLRAAQNEVSPASLAARKDLEKLILGERDVSVLEGWRRPMAGEDLLAMLEGKRSVMVREGGLVMESR